MLELNGLGIEGGKGVLSDKIILISVWIMWYDSLNKIKNWVLFLPIKGGQL